MAGTTEARTFIFRPVSIEKLIGTPPKVQLSKRPRAGDNLAAAFYKELAKYPLEPCVVDYPGQHSDRLIFGPALSGMGVNCLLYFAAPYKNYGLDTNDILTDWYDLFHPRDEYERRRLEGHRRLEGWADYERVKDLLYHSINHDHADFNGYLTRFVHSDETFPTTADLGPNSVVPVLKWRESPNERKWSYELNDADHQLRQQLSGKIKTAFPDQLVAALGPVLVAGYSPKVVAGWPRYAEYPQAENENSMGPTQVLPLALCYSQPLLSERLVEAFEHYMANPANVIDSVG